VLGARSLRAATSFGGALSDVARPLADPQFRQLWLATLAWNFARWMEMTVTGWVALDMTGSPWLVAVVAVCRSAFLPVAGPITGALSDRFDRVRLIKVAQWGNVLAVGTVAAALLAGHGAYWQVVVSSLWLGASWGIDWPSRRALIADMVGPERVLQAIVLDNVTQNLSRVLGPLLGGLVIAAYGGSGAYTALAVSFLVASLTMVPVVGAAKPVVQVVTSMWRDMALGLQYARRDPTVWAVLVITIYMNMLLFPYMGLMSVFAEQVLHVGPVGLGQMGALNGAGASLGLFILSAMRRGGMQARAFAFGSLLGCLCICLFALSRSFPLSLALLFVSGIGTSAFGTMQSTLILSRTEPAMRGRVVGLLAFCIGSAPLGSLLLGALVEQLGPPAAVSILCGVCGALVIWSAARARLFSGGR
jgi:MFS family permease